MDDAVSRYSPAGRPIRLRDNRYVPPEWVARRRRTYNVIDTLADGAKRIVRRWLLPRPKSATSPRGPRGTAAAR
jgi:hypothetical protein